MSVSVIIPAYNAAKYLPETIEELPAARRQYVRQGTLMTHDEAFLRKKLLSWPDETPERSQLTVWGYRYRSRQIFQLRMQWTRDSLRAGKPVQAVKNLRHAAQMYRIYALGPQAVKA